MAASRVSSMASITRNAVGTEATAPKTSACRRRPSRFARASPPPAMVTARSEITLPGSWRRRRLHIGAGASDRASVSPERSAISASRRLPAWVASPLPSAVTFNAGRHLVAFTWYVPSDRGSWCLDNPIFPGQEGFFAALPPLHSTVNERCGLGLRGSSLRRPPAFWLAASFGQGYCRPVARGLAIALTPMLAGRAHRPNGCWVSNSSASSRPNGRSSPATISMGMSAGRIRRASDHNPSWSTRSHQGGRGSGSRDLQGGGPGFAGHALLRGALGGVWLGFREHREHGCAVEFPIDDCAVNVPTIWPPLV